MANISLQHLDKIYDNNVQAVYDFNLEVKDGEWRGKKMTSIKVSINGKQLYDFMDFDKTYTKGHFAFQQHDPGSKVSIRKVEVQGHTDGTGTPAHNQKLSEDRASSVVAWLTAHGIASERLTAKGYGDSKPLVPNVTELNKARNRRVQFIITEQDTPPAVNPTAPGPLGGPAVSPAPTPLGPPALGSGAAPKR